MVQDEGIHCRRLIALAVFSTLLAIGGSAAAQAEEDESTPPAEAPATAAPGKAEPKKTPAAADAAARAPESRAAFIEEMGPDTYPGRLRGIYGGSMWLEPDFHGLQWPRNTRTGIGISGYAWIDSGYEKIVRDRAGLPQLPDSSLFLQQARGVLRVTPAYVDGDFFVQGQLELVANPCQAASSLQALNPNLVCVNTGIFTTDDLWLRVGRWNSWDLKVGRFQGWEVFHLGMGLDPHTLERLGAGMFGVDAGTNPRLEVPSLYTVNYLQDRATEGLAVGAAAVHLYPTDFLRFELLARLGNDNYRADMATGMTAAFSYYGARPAAVLDLGWLKVKAGAEYEKRTPVTQVLASEDGSKKNSPEGITRKGVGGSVAFIVNPIVEFGVNAAVGKTEHVDQYATVIGQNSFTTRSIGGFANVSPFRGFVVGVGGGETTQLDEFLAAGSTVNDWVRQLQGFGAVQYVLAERLFVKAVFAYARAEFQPSDVQSLVWNNTMYGGRVRLMYLF